MRIFKTGFTLAEVLITLGVIGVVAAITIPNLISNYQKKTWTTQLQHSYALLNQGFRRMLADDNVSDLSGTETFLSIGGDLINRTAGPMHKSCRASNDVNGDNCGNFYDSLRKYFKIADVRNLTASDNYKIKKFNGQTFNDGYSPIPSEVFSWNPYEGTAITLMDGTMIFNYIFDSNDTQGNTNNEMRGHVGEFFIDVNGLKKPNKIGRDIFYFYLGDNGIVYPVGSKAYSEYYHNYGNYYWRTALNADYACTNGEGFGYGCGARVLEEGNMNYKDGRMDDYYYY